MSELQKLTLIFDSFERSVRCNNSRKSLLKNFHKIIQLTSLHQNIDSEQLEMYVLQIDEESGIANCLYSWLYCHKLKPLTATTWLPLKHNYGNSDGSRPCFSFLRHDQRFSLKTETVTFGYVEHQIMSSNFSQTVTVNTHLVQ